MHWRLWLSVFKTFDVHVQSALAQMAGIILAKSKENRENIGRTTPGGLEKGVQRGSEDKISNLLLLTWYSFQKESHFIALYNNNCYIKLYLL